MVGHGAARVVVDAIYRDLELPEERWLDGIRTAAQSAFRRKDGTVVTSMQLGSGDRVTVRAATSDGSAERAHIESLGQVGVPHDGSMTGMMNAFQRLLPSRLNRELFRAGPVTRLSEAAARARYGAAFRRFQHLGFTDCHNAIGLDASGAGVVLSLSVEARVLDPSARALARIAGHLAAAHRLRRRAPRTEAVLERGRVVHAEGEARDPKARAALLAAARRIDATPRRSTTEGAEIWTALIDGRWSLLERFDADGRRFVVARRNDPPRAAELRLTPTERAIVGLLSLGRPQKCVAFELGIAPSTVSAGAGTALAKLSLRTRRELIELRGALTEEASW